MRIQPCPGFGPPRNEGEVIEVQPGPSTIGWFLTAHSYAQASAGNAGHSMLSFQSPSRFQSTRMLSITVRAAAAQLQARNVIVFGLQVLKLTGAASPASLSP